MKVDCEGQGGHKVDLTFLPEESLDIWSSTSRTFFARRLKQKSFPTLVPLRLLFNPM